MLPRRLESPSTVTAAESSTKSTAGSAFTLALGASIKQRQSGGSRPKSSGSNRKLRAGRIVRPGSQMPRQGTSSSHAISEASTLRLGMFDY